MSDKSNSDNNSENSANIRALFRLDTGSNPRKEKPVSACYLDTKKYVSKLINNSFRFLESHNGAVTAAATVAIGCLTYSLAQDSRRQAESVEGQLKIMRDQLSEMKSGSEQVERAISASARQAAAAEYANRAWIAVGTVDIEGAWEKGKDATVKIIFVNTGREAATSIRNHPKIFKIPVTSAFKFGETKFYAGKNATCDSVFNEDGGILAFPDPRRENYARATVGGELLDEAFFAGEYAIILQGCISYLSSGTIKLTAYCFMVGKGNEHASAMKSPWCEDGNFTN